MIKLKKIKMWKSKKHNQIVTRLMSLNFDKTHKLIVWQNS